MNKIIITTDSGIDPLNEENMISGQLVENNTKCYRDIREISSKEILEKIKQGSVFKTASPILSDYSDKFEQILSSGNDVIHLSMSSGISEGSINSANLMAATLNDDYENKVYVIDTLNGATGGTLINEIAKDLVKEGYGTTEIIAQLEDIKKNITTSFYVPNPQGFLKSGRNKSELCLKEKALLIGAKALEKMNYKFRVDFNEQGNLFTRSTLRGKNNTCMYKIVKEIVNKDNKDIYDPKYVVIGNLNQKEVDMNNLKEYLESLKYFDNIIDKNINGVVAAYGCDDLCGISLVKKR